MAVNYRPLTLSAQLRPPVVSAISTRGVVAESVKSAADKFKANECATRAAISQ